MRLWNFKYTQVRPALTSSRLGPASVHCGTGIRLREPDSEFKFPHGAGSCAQAGAVPRVARAPDVMTRVLAPLYTKAAVDQQPLRLVTVTRVRGKG